MTTYRYTDDMPQAYPGYYQMFIPEDPAEGTTCTQLIGRPNHGGYAIDVVRCVDPLGGPVPPLPVPPNDGRWAVDSG